MAIALGLHGLAALGVVGLAGAGLTFGHWLVPLGLAAALLASLWWRLRTLGNQRDRELVLGPGGWTLESPGQQPVAVSCGFVYLSPWLVVVTVAFRGQRRGVPVALVRACCSADHWRRLHSVARATRRGSGVLDDGVLGGKVDGHQDGVPGHR